METAAITDAGALRQRYASPSARAVNKQMDRLDAHCRAFLAASPFVVMGTSALGGLGDVSPRGGEPGFVAVLNDTQLAIPDYSGNNRLDSLQNLVENPGIGLLFLVPGIEHTLRVNGTSTITDDPAVLDACIGRVAPRIAIVVAIAEVYLHCAKSVKRAALWQPENWPDPSNVPSYACAVRDHADLDMSVEDIDADIERGYREAIWQPGGNTSP